MKTVLITGATRNTGLAVARRFAQAGYQIALTSRDAAAAQTTAKMLAQAYGVQARGYAMSFDSVESIRQTFLQAERELGGLNVFVANSANLGVGLGLRNTSPEDFDSVMNVNLKGTFFCCQCAAEGMIRSGGGSIVTIGSVQGVGAVSGRTIYGMSKAALSLLVKSMAYELGEYGIRANNVVAGAIHSERWDSMDREELAMRRGRYPAGRESTEEEIAEAVYFLCSERAATITGTDLTVDSGLCACMLPYEKRGK